MQTEVSTTRKDPEAEQQHLNGKAEPAARKPKRLSKKAIANLAPLDKPMDRPVDGDTTDPSKVHRNNYHNDTAAEDVTALTKTYPHEDVAVLVHSDKIRTTYQRTVESIVETGSLLIAAKKALGFGKFGLMFRYLPFSQRQADYLMAIARHPILGNSQYFANLPQSWATLHVLAGLTAEQVKSRIDNQHINPTMTMREAKLICSSNGIAGKQHASKLISELLAFTTYCTPQELVDYNCIASPAPTPPIGGAPQLPPVRELAKWLADWASLSEAFLTAHEAEMEDAFIEHMARKKIEDQDEPNRHNYRDDRFKVANLHVGRAAKRKLTDEERLEIWKALWEIREEARRAEDDEDVEKYSKLLADFGTKDENDDEVEQLRERLAFNKAAEEEENKAAEDTPSDG